MLPDIKWPVGQTVLQRRAQCWQPIATGIRTSLKKHTNSLEVVTLGLLPQTPVRRTECFDRLPAIHHNPFTTTSSSPSSSSSSHRHQYDKPRRDRSRIDTGSTQDRSRIDPGSIQDRYRIDTGPIQDQYRLHRWLVLTPSRCRLWRLVQNSSFEH